MLLRQWNAKRKKMDKVIQVAKKLAQAALQSPGEKAAKRKLPCIRKGKTIVKIKQIDMMRAMLVGMLMKTCF